MFEFMVFWWDLLQFFNDSNISVSNLVSTYYNFIQNGIHPMFFLNINFLPIF